MTVETTGMKNPAKGRKRKAESQESVTSNPVGRPAKFETPEDMQTTIDNYFAQCKVEDRPSTFAGLALALDMTTQSLRNYSKDEQFFCIVKKARQRIEAEVEARLYGGNATGSIFWLKNNAGWKDKTETEVTGKDGAPLDLTVNFVKSNG